MDRFGVWLWRFDLGFSGIRELGVSRARGLGLWDFGDAGARGSGFRGLGV